MPQLLTENYSNIRIIMIGVVIIFAIILGFIFVRFVSKMLLSLIIIGTILIGVWFTYNQDTTSLIETIHQTKSEILQLKDDLYENDSKNVTDYFNQTKDGLLQIKEGFFSDTSGDQIHDYYVPPLDSQQTSTVSDGAAKYGATLIFGELDSLERSTYAHIQLQENATPSTIDPTTNKPRQSRDERINVDPTGWKNYQLSGNWVNNRSHLVGYQFSGINDDVRNLMTSTAYLNKGVEDQSMDDSNPDSMLFYEKQLRQWLINNPNDALDYYVRPLYIENDLTPSAVYMQWVGLSDEKIIPIKTKGHAQRIKNKTYGVILKNQSPSYIINTQTGQVTLK